MASIQIVYGAGATATLVNQGPGQVDQAIAILSDPSQVITVPIDGGRVVIPVRAVTALRITEK
ncbi:hypothetical protein F4553_003964 [Allocatelliglobosispora scoriae]|uniref:Uncharacterized protein n=1 Tax=Allocatelliglobosispora scoriae TaxID=643052 RepID=A0A841BSA7_9ACTN|nr:hypothetical protein [Allocatelliglobosispora scoriae]MBB5870585.1 hypothetical protein [Allocatelliglobosispora scoriae]